MIQILYTLYIQHPQILDMDNPINDITSILENQTNGFFTILLYEFNRTLNVDDPKLKNDVLTLIANALPDIDWTKTYDRQCVSEYQTKPRKGERCKARALPGNDYCGLHVPNSNMGLWLKQMANSRQSPISPSKSIKNKNTADIQPP